MMQTPGIGHNNPPADDERTPQRAPTNEQIIGEFAANARQHFEQADASKRVGREKIRLALQNLFEIFSRLRDDPQEREKLRAVCNRTEFRFRSTDLATMVVRYYGKVRDNEKSNRYANVLKEAQHLKIEPSTLASYLQQQGQGIKVLSDAHIARKNGDEIDLSSDADPLPSGKVSKVKRSKLKQKPHSLTGKVTPSKDRRSKKEKKAASSTVRLECNEEFIQKLDEDRRMQLWCLIRRSSRRANWTIKKVTGSPKISSPKSGKAISR